jgi:hypothetical protein
MAVLVSDSDADWREYERAGRFLSFIWERFMAKKNNDAVYVIYVIFIVLCFLGFIIGAIWK